MSLEEMMHTLTSRIQRAISTTFTQFTKSHKETTDPKEMKQNVVVSFLALLELVKQNTILVEQAHMFDEIDIKSITVGNNGSQNAELGVPVIY
jgi:chromatin segregation and condensation protein Rec8/ScpA/Scc1 (kleisin family)